MAAVTFDPAAFIARFPEFAAVDSAYLQLLFDTGATMLLDNTEGSPVQDVVKRANLLNLIVAHLVKLAPPAAGPGVGGQETVGRISNATQGSVSVATDMLTQSTSAAYWNQTQYGALYWAATAFLRTMRHVAAPRRNMGVPTYGYPFRRF
jgi:hypothetical protein